MSEGEGEEAEEGERKREEGGREEMDPLSSVDNSSVGLCPPFFVSPLSAFTFSNLL